MTETLARPVAPAAEERARLKEGVHIERSSRRVRTYFGNKLIADSEHVLLVDETKRPPAYWFEMPEGPFRCKSAHTPVPLSEIEEALLVGAGAGFSGLALWDLPTPAPYRRRSGRTFPTTRPGGDTALFFTNDEGLYVLDANVAASKLREIETPDERTKLLEVYRAQRRELRRGRLDIPRRIPPMSGHDLWDSNRPGLTLFLPVGDVSASLISLIAQFVDPALRRYAPAGGGMNIVDDRHGYRPAGTERWSKDGFLDAETDAAAIDHRAAGLLLRLQRAGGNLPEHVPGNRGPGAGRMEALRISLARNSQAHGLPHRRGEWRSDIRHSGRARRRVRGKLSALSPDLRCSS